MGRSGSENRGPPSCSAKPVRKHTLAVEGQVGVGVQDAGAKGADNLRQVSGGVRDLELLAANWKPLVSREIARPPSPLGLGQSQSNLGRVAYRLLD